MRFQTLQWDLDDDPRGNVQHCAEHGIQKDEVAQVFRNSSDVDVSRKSGRPVVFGNTDAGRHLMVVFERIDKHTVYPVTAFDVPRKRLRRKRS